MHTQLLKKYSYYVRNENPLAHYFAPIEKMNDLIVHEPATSKTYTGKMIRFTYLVFNIQNQLITILRTYKYHYGEK